MAQVPMTTFVAWLALVVSSASLAWQVVSWRNSGPRIRVQLREIIPLHGFPGAYVIVLFNDGRQAVTVPEVRVQARVGAVINVLQVRWGVDIERVTSTPLPVIVDPGAEVRVYASYSEMREQMGQSDLVRQQMRMSDPLGNEQLTPQARVGTSWVDGKWHSTGVAPA